MSILRAFTLILLILAGQVPLRAQELTDDAKLTFPVPPVVIIKLKKSSKTSVKGTLTSLTKLEAVIENEKGIQHVSFDRIDSLKTPLVEFDGEDAYQDICQKVKAAYRVKISSASDPAAEDQPGTGSSLPGSAEAMRAAPTKPEVPKSALGQGGFGGINNIQKPKAEEAPVAPNLNENEPKASTPLPGSAESMASGATEVYICDKCKKEITGADLKAGQCPHCKTEFAMAVAAPPTGTAANPFGAPKAANGNANPFGGQQAQPAPVGGGPVPAPPVVGAPVVIQGGNGFTLDSIPNWAKGGLFVLLVLVGYHVVFNR